MNTRLLSILLLYPLTLIIDYFTPRGYSVWILYSIPFIFLSITYYKKTFLFYLITVFFIWLGFFLSVPGVPIVYSAINRIAASMIFIIIAFLIYNYKKEEDSNLARLNKALEQKTTLLREIHHRVKNNLQIISSLLSLQSSYLENEELKKIFLDYRSRIRSMALVHEKIYRTNDEKFLNIQDYLADLADEIFRSYLVDKKIIKLKMDVEPSNFAIDKVILLGLLLTELISNSLKHAFDTEEGEISISLKISENQAFLSYQDNGKGIPPGIKVNEPDTLGLTLIRTFTEQLEGSCSIKNDNGFKYQCSFNI